MFEIHMLKIHYVCLNLYIHLHCTLKSPNIVFQKMTVTVIWGSQCFNQHHQHQVRQTSQMFTVFLTQNFKHLLVNGIAICWNVVSQLIEQIDNRTPVFLK